MPDTAGLPDGEQNLKPAILDDLELKLWKLLLPVIAILGAVISAMWAILNGNFLMYRAYRILNSKPC